MSFLDKLSAINPFGKKEEILEYFFALNISNENLTAALWTIEGRQLKILESQSENYLSLEDLPKVTDKLLDLVLGIRDLNVEKILFGVPSSWLSDENLKGEYLKVLRDLVKELELKPMAYVETAHALVHLLEKKEGIPPTAVLVGFEQYHLTVAVTRAGKLDGAKIVTRGENSGADIEKALLQFSNIETLPSKILIYGEKALELKDQLLSFSWMSKLSFLHLPKIDILSEDVEIKSICLAGASEIQESVSYTDSPINQAVKKSGVLTNVADEESEKREIAEVDGEKKETEPAEIEAEVSEDENFGFVVGDVSENKSQEEVLPSSEIGSSHDESSEDKEETMETNLTEVDDFEKDLDNPITQSTRAISKFSLKSLSIQFRDLLKGRAALLLTIIGILFLILGAYLFLPKAQVKIFVEPKILEKDTQAIADPSQKSVLENEKIIPGQVVETEISGSDKDSTSGKKEIGDPAKGTVIVYNKTSESKSLSKGTTLTSKGLKFSLDDSITIASQSAADSGITYGKKSGTVTALAVGADGNLPSGSELSVGALQTSQVSAKAEGNFSGGTSKEVTVVSSEDQQRLLAKLSSALRLQAQQKLQEQYPNKKVLEEALSETLLKKSYSKNINDQASEFSLNLTARYKGTAFEDKDLKLIVSKLVTTDVPEGFALNLEDTETQADVSKLEKDGKLIFLARFKAKLLPKIDTEKVKNQIKGKSVRGAQEIIRSMENVLGSEVKISPALPTFLQRMPLLGGNIKIEVGLK